MEGKASLASTVLLLSISASWVGVSQLARASEVENEELQHVSVVPLVSWANATAWILLASPFVLRQARDTKSCGGSLITSTAFKVYQPAQFMAIALSTNIAYIGALHYLQASLNTAIFSISPVFTLLLSSTFLPVEGLPTSQTRTLSEKVFSELQTRRAASVLLSVVGVLLIVQPWKKEEPNHGSRHARFMGAALSLFSALGTATYQVYFKKTFGDSMQPEEVGLFLAYMGCFASLGMGTSLMAALRGGVYQLDLEKVPWALVLSTALSSSLFNFLMKFGLSRETPVTTSLGTQIGIPLNLLLDVLVVGSHIDFSQVMGTLTMLASFTLWHMGSEAVHAAKKPPASSGSAAARLLAE